MQNTSPSNHLKVHFSGSSAPGEIEPSSGSYTPDFQSNEDISSLFPSDSDTPGQETMEDEKQRSALAAIHASFSRLIGGASSSQSSSKAVNRADSSSGKQEKKRILNLLYDYKQRKQKEGYTREQIKRNLRKGKHLPKIKLPPEESYLPDSIYVRFLAAIRDCFRRN